MAYGARVDCREKVEEKGGCGCSLERKETTRKREKSKNGDANPGPPTRVKKLNPHWHLYFFDPPATGVAGGRGGVSVCNHISDLHNSILTYLVRDGR